jgi:hypothetical protein
MKKKRIKRATKRMSNTKLMFLGLVLLFIIFEALFILKGQPENQPQVAGVETSR